MKNIKTPKRKFYAFQYASGPQTTCGQPNVNTGRYSIAGDLAVFSSKLRRNAWVDGGAITLNMAGNCRESVTAKTARDLCAGMSSASYAEYINFFSDELGDELSHEIIYDTATNSLVFRPTGD